jgi:hypothetical protein
VELLTEEVGFVCEEDLCAFDLSQVEALGLSFLCSSHDGIAEGSYMLPELLSIVDYLFQKLFLVGLKGKHRNLILPRLEIF